MFIWRGRFALVLLGPCLGSACQTALNIQPQGLSLSQYMPPMTERAQHLLPYGEPVPTEQAATLIPAGELTLESARVIALRANPDIHAALARLESASARINPAKSRFFPSIDFTQNAVRTFQTPASRNRLATALAPAPVVPVDIGSETIALTSLLNALRLPLLDGGRGDGDTNSFSEHSSAFTISWTAFDGMIRDAQLQATRFLESAAEQSLLDTQRLLTRAVDVAYFRIQLAHEQVRIAEADEAFSREQFEETRKLMAAGRATQADVDNFRVRVLAAQASLTAAIGDRDTGRAILGDLMGLPDAALPPDLALPSLTEETEEELAVPELGPWIARALTHRPDLVQLEKILKSEEAQVRAVKGQYWPTVTASGSWGFDRSSNIAYDVDDQSSAGGIEFRWELFDGGRRAAQVREAEGLRSEAAANLMRLRLSVQSEVRQAVIDLNDAQQRIRLQRETLKTALETRRIVRAAYVAGKETLSRLNEAQRDVITAEANLALARIRLRGAWSDLRASAGFNGVSDKETETTEP